MELPNFFLATPSCLCDSAIILLLASFWLQYTLETYIETRSTAWEQEPYTGIVPMITPIHHVVKCLAKSLSGISTPLASSSELCYNKYIGGTLPVWTA